MNRPATLLVVIFIACLVFAALSLRSDFQPSSTPSSFSVSGILQNDDDDGFEKATEPREFSFPKDYGPHDRYRTEWWYFTGNLDDERGRRFGYQLTFFRYRPTSQEFVNDSEWRTRQIYMAHFAVSDIEDERQHSFERFSRAAAGLAGAKTNRLHVWLDNWSAKSEQASGFPLRLRAQENGVSVDLQLDQGKPMVLHGEKGLSRKNDQLGGASYYYSFTRMPSKGSITINGEQFQVNGLSWMDREWSTSVLSPDQLGWDWFALQLSDGQELMLYQFRRKDNKPDPFSYGVLISPEGHTKTLAYDMFDIEVKKTWQSPRDGSRYPTQWRLSVRAYDISLEVQAAIANQELNLSFRYWEGAVVISGNKRGEDISGRGYVELTGYVNSGSNKPASKFR